MAQDLDNPNVRDVHNVKNRWKKWRKGEKANIGQLPKADRDLILRFLDDMEKGKHTSVFKGRRSYHRLLALASRVPRIATWFNKHCDKPLTKLTFDDAHEVFSKVDNGEILTQYGKRYKSYSDYIKDFKTFWHWYMKSEKLDNKRNVIDITEYLETKAKVLKFHWFKEEGWKLLLENAKPKYKALILFMQDAGVRAPSELFNVRRSDLGRFTQKDKSFYDVTIRLETSKTTQRKIRLFLASDRLEQYIRDNKIKQNDFLFPFNEKGVNKYFSKLGHKLFNFGDLKKDSKGVPFVTYGLTLYDLRHNSACHHLNLLPTHTMLYRFGWKSPKRIEDYTQFLGQRDTSTEDMQIAPDDRLSWEKELNDQVQETAKVKAELTELKEQTKVKDEVIAGKIAKLKKDFLTAAKSRYGFTPTNNPNEFEVSYK